MPSRVNHQVLLRSRPEGIPQAEHFEIVERRAPDPGPGQILVSQRVRHGILGAPDCREVGPLELKGFSRPVEAHEVIALH